MLEATAELSSRNLRRYIREAWPVVEPETPYVHGYHVDAIADHLMAVSSGQIKDLIINIPPRHSKSRLVSVMWPTWEWTKRPSTQFLFSSYGMGLSLRDSMYARRLLRDPWYQVRWGCPDPEHKTVPLEECPSRFHLASDQDTKHYFSNDRGGHRFATSVDSQTTGFGGDILVLDDPHNIQDAESEVMRQGAVDYVDQSWSRRGNNPKTARRVVIMQRVHLEDVTGHLLKKGGWVHLCLPAEYERKGFSYTKHEKPAPNPLGWKDWRKEDGELLWPEHFGPPEIAKAKLDGNRAYATQFLQKPTAVGGDMFNVEKLREHIILPEQLKDMCWLTVRGWDLAASTKPDSKRTAGVKMSKDDAGRFYIRHVKLGKWNPDDRNAEMKSMARRDGFGIRQLIEMEGGSSGIDQELAITRLLAGHVTEFIKVTGDKAVRADSFAAHCNAGNVSIVDDGTWDYEEYLLELQSFPNGTYKDQVDASSLSFNWLTQRAVIRMAAENPKPLPEHLVDKLHRETSLPPADWRDNMPSLND